MDKIYKTRCAISEEEYDKIIKGDVKFLLDKDDVAKRFYVNYRTRIMRPKLIIEYTRTAYVSPNSDIRVTLDEDITTYRPNDGLFVKSDRGIKSRKDNPIVLEVKYHDYMPSIIPIVLGKLTVLSTNFSKYAMSFEKLYIRSSWR
jgi:hypothetical protein